MGRDFSQVGKGASLFKPWIDDGFSFRARKRRKVKKETKHYTYFLFFKPRPGEHICALSANWIPYYCRDVFLRTAGITAETQILPSPQVIFFNLHFQSLLNQSFKQTTCCLNLSSFHFAQLLKENWPHAAAAVVVAVFGKSFRNFRTDNQFSHQNAQSDRFTNSPRGRSSHTTNH